MYLNYAREHWMKHGENPPVGFIFCAEKGASEAHYALDNLPNKVLAAEYRTILPDEIDRRRTRSFAQQTGRMAPSERLKWVVFGLASCTLLYAMVFSLPSQPLSWNPTRIH